jgi:hypothetical protein
MTCISTIIKYKQIFMYYKLFFNEFWGIIISYNLIIIKIKVFVIMENLIIIKTGFIICE